MTDIENENAVDGNAGEDAEVMEPIGAGEGPGDEEMPTGGGDAGTRAPAPSPSPREDFVLGVEGELTEQELEEELALDPFPARDVGTSPASGAEPEDIARLAAQAASDRKAEDILVLELTELSDVCDYFVIATGANTRLVDSVVDEIEERVAASFGEKPFSIEGRRGKTWILMDYGSVVVHVFTPETRAYYQLEKLWGDAPQLELDLY